MLQNSHQQRRDTQGHRTNASNPTGTPASSFSLGRPSPFRPQSSPFLTEHSLTKDQSPPKDRHHPESPITSTFSSSCLVPNITRNHNRTSSVDDYTNVARHDRMTSLFQRARSRTPYSPLEGMNSPKDNPGSPVTPQHSDQATAILRQSHLQRLRERAEEARLELMAYEMMEGDTQVGQERQVLSPILHSVEPEDEESIQTPRPAATQQKSRSELNRHGLVPVDVRTTRSPHTARYQQQTQPVPRATNPLPSWRGSQQSFERIVPLRLETQQIQTRSTISRSQTTPTPTMNLNRGTSERASPATQPLAHRPRSSTIYSRPSLGLRVSPLEVTPSLISPATSPSPPVSPIASATLAAEIHRAICGAVSKESFLHTRHRESGHSTQSGGWRATPKRKIAEKSSYNGDEDEDESDRFLQEHLDNCQEDLRDITLSEILNNQLCLSSDGSDGPYNNGPDSPRDMKPKSPVAADTTIADRTGIFMLAHQGVPSLLSETIPDIDLADLTFMTCQDSEDEDETTPVPPPNYHSQGRGNRILHQLPPMAIPKESILDEFLKSLPPLPHSPMIDGRWPSQQMHLRSGPDAIPNRRFARAVDMDLCLSQHRSSPRATGVNKSFKV
ncbi:hypothetical protein BGZ83_011123 [Gryganskiella cystojenkinii]|nr:hypothetical protein BGZ83_011123 [Gryganskiella cystojenkinii]